MRITSMELAGSSKPGSHVPRAFACISRRAGEALIKVAILLPNRRDGGSTRFVKPDAEDAMRSAAEEIRLRLEGHRGSNSEVLEVVRLLQHFE